MDADHAKYKELAMIWKRAAPHLAAMRRRDIRLADNASAIRSLSSLCRHAIKTNRPSKTSGFVQMYQILKRSNG